MSSNLKVFGEMDVTGLVETEAEWKARLRALDEEGHRVERGLASVTRKAASAAHAIGNLIKVFAKHLPEGMQSIVDAGVELVVTSVVTLDTVAIAYGSGIVTAPLAVAVSLASLAMASMGMAAALDAQTRLDSATQQMVSDWMQVSQSINTLTGLLGGRRF